MSLLRPPPIPDLPTAQRALLDALIPEATTTRVSWSEGETQVIEAGAGPPLLFVHGGFSQATEWLPLWPLLADRYRLLAIDRPGHGMADLYDYEGVDTLDLAVRFLSEMLDALNLDRVPVVANSMGGRWALELALRHPERVERLVLVGAPAGSTRWLPLLLFALRWPGARTVIKRVFRRADAARVRDFAGRILVAHPERLSDAYLTALAAGQRRQYASLLGFARRVIAYRTIHPAMLLDGVWPQLQVPTYFVWGDADAFDKPTAGQVALAQIPAPADLTVVPDAGHLPWLDAPEAVARAIEEAMVD